MIARRFAVLILAVALPMSTSAETWTVTSLASPGSVDERNWLNFIAKVEEDSSGDVRIRALIRGEAGAERAYLAGLRRGRTQLSSASFAGSAAIVPEVSVLSLPYLFQSVEEIDFAVDCYLDGLFRDLFAEKGLEVLRWYDVGWVNLYGIEPYRTPQQAAKVRLRSPASPAARVFLQRVGADVIVLPFEEIIVGLDTGLIDGGVTTGIMYEAALRDKAPHFVMTRHSYDVGFLLANRRWYQGLSEEKRLLIERSFSTTTWIRKQTRLDNQARLAKLKQAGAVIELSGAELDEWRRAGSSGNADFVDDLGPKARQVYVSVLEAKRAFARGARVCADLPQGE